MINSWWIGIIFLQIVVICWITSSFLLNNLFKTFNHPILVTYCSVSTCSIYLLPLLKEKTQQAIRNYNKGKSLNYQYIETETETETDQIESNGDAVPITYIMKISLIFGTIWFMANLTTNASLSYTTVTLQTILSSTASFFTLLFSVLLQIDKINFKRLIGIILSFSGIILIVWKKDDTTQDSSSHFDNKNIIVGNLLAIMGAIIYGCYSSLFKLNVSGPQITNNNNNYNQNNKQVNNKIGNNKSQLPSINIIIGFIGFFTMTMLWPVLVIAHYLNIEKFELPQNNWSLLLILGNCTITIISNYCWANAIKNTTPLTVTMGLSFTIPLSMIIEFFINLNKNTDNGGSNMNQIDTKYFIGAILILISFILINYDTGDNDKTLADDSDELAQLCEKHGATYDSMV